jgi:hypothetical protein
MVKFTHMFVTLILIFWLAGSGCVENDTSEVEEAGIVPGIPGIEGNTSAGQELTETDIQEFEENITELEDLLKNSSLEEEIVVEGL